MVAAVASLGVGIWAVGKKEGEIEKAKAEGEGLKVFWEKMPYIIVLVIVLTAAIVLIAQPKFLFGEGS